MDYYVPKCENRERQVCQNEEENGIRIRYLQSWLPILQEYQRRGRELSSYSFQNK